MINWKRKLSSRKFLAAVAGLVAGIKISKVRTGNRPGENVSDSDTEI